MIIGVFQLTDVNNIATILLNLIVLIALFRNRMTRKQTSLYATELS